MKISITRALSELKFLKDRILKTGQGIKPVDIFQNKSGNALLSNITIDDFKKSAIAMNQSFIDLSKRYNQIKSAIMISNSKISVAISGKKYLVIEAIQRKESIGFEENYLKYLKNNYSDCLENIEKSKVNLDKSIEEMIKQNVGKDKKVNADDYNNIAKPFLEANEIKILDPLDIKNLIDKYEKEITEFKNEVDFVLSESNSQTLIDID